ncbi:uncharacterized protein LOC103397875 [Cynoglossus semilaevis]|uniref:Interleukin-1 n=1 Tax=Cynoglossus semilaevis TaxID=244447 RepID=C9WPT5_CYNSE|nr:uncharacterized protein LOC103397875 [Cynoglossus semilaevis]ACU55137.1 IL-1b [Cynoglossus semilaevis]
MESEMKCSISEMWLPTMPKGLQLEISQHPMTMRQVVNLVIALERLKAGRSESVMSTEFRDENLLSIMLDTIVEEQLVIGCTAAPPDEFYRTGMHQCSVADNQKRNFVLNSMELHAVMLQAGSDKRKVFLNMSTYIFNPSSSTEAKPVALCIKDTDLYLSCHMENEMATLHLEEVKDPNRLSNIRAGSDDLRFLFYKRDTGVSLSTLMSARYPNWFISTAKEDNKKVDLCRETSQRYQNFTIHQRQS